MIIYWHSMPLESYAHPTHIALGWQRKTDLHMELIYREVECASLKHYG